MTFGEFRRLSWIKIDPYGYDIFVRPTKKTVLGWLNGEDVDYDTNEDIDSLIEKVKIVSRKHKLYWEFVKIGSNYYIDVISSAQDITNFDDCEVDYLDLSNFKMPTLFLMLDV